MMGKEATAEVFWTAFRSLGRRDREGVIQRLLRDRRMREDLIDIVTALQREHEETIPYEEVRAELEKTGRL